MLTFANTALTHTRTLSVCVNWSLPSTVPACSEAVVHFHFHLTRLSTSCPQSHVHTCCVVTSLAEHLLFTVLVELTALPVRLDISRSVVGFFSVRWKHLGNPHWTGNLFYTHEEEELVLHISILMLNARQSLSEDLTSDLGICPHFISSLMPSLCAQFSLVIIIVIN